MWLACRPSLFQANTVPTMAEFATRWLAVERYQSIDDTNVQLLISQASVLMTRVDRIQSESSQPRIRRRNMKILMVLTSHDVLGNTGRKTDFWFDDAVQTGPDRAEGALSDGQACRREIGRLRHRLLCGRTRPDVGPRRKAGFPSLCSSKRFELTRCKESRLGSYFDRDRRVLARSVMPGKMIQVSSWQVMEEAS